MTESWMEAEGCFIPKEDQSSQLKQFRTISLLNVEGKIFLAVLARRLTSFMLSNGYIDIAVQKGGVPGVSGCVEHTGALTQIIREARENKKGRPCSAVVGLSECLWFNTTQAGSADARPVPRPREDQDSTAGLL